MKKFYLLTSVMFLFIGFTSNAQIVISQIYGGGGNTGAQYLNDFVELFNRGTASVDVSGWSVQYASAAGTAWSVNAIPAATSIAPGKYFLIKLAAATTSGIALPTPDLDITTSPINMSGTSGKVALVNNITALTGATLTVGTYVDLVGYGTGSAFEGTAAVGTLSNTTAAIRINGGCTDTNSNSTDFTIGAPTPRNSATATSICSTSPSITITSPANASIYNPLTTTVTVNVFVANFSVANGTGAGNIRYTVDGGAVILKYDTTPIVLTGLSVGSHIVVVSLVDNAQAPLSPAVSTTTQFTIAAFTNVSTISALRAGTLNAYFTLTGTAVVSHVRNPSGAVTVAATRNQKIIQDATGGILLDDVAGKITTTFILGDSMNNVSGQIGSFNGVLQFVPLQNQNVISSGNMLTSQLISLPTFNSNVDNYESELISFNAITINGTVTAGVVTALTAGAVFVVNTNYSVTDGTNLGVLRTGFAEANYIGSTVPTGTFNITAIGYDNVTAAIPPVLTPQFVPRNAADFSVTLQTQNNEISGLKIYPNPVSNGVLHIETNLNTLKNISLFDVLGKQVLNTTTINNTITIADLNSGIYILKITENGNTATRKLVVE